MLTRSSLMASNPRSTPRARSLSGAGYDSPRVRPMPHIRMVTAKQNRSLLLSSPLAFSCRRCSGGCERSRNFSTASRAGAIYSLHPHHRHHRQGNAVSLRQSTSAAPLTAPRSLPMPGIIAPMPLFQWRQLSGFLSRSSAAKNGKARMITRPCSPVPLSLPQGRGYSARLCAKFSIPRRAAKLARVFDTLHVPSPA